MACSWNAGVRFFGLNGAAFQSRTMEVLGFAPPVCPFQYRETNFPILGSEFNGGLSFVSDQKGSAIWRTTAPAPLSAEASIWIEKTLKPNIYEISSAQGLVDSLRSGGERLVIVDFYSPDCGGCRALHPKIFQLAEENPDAVFLKINYEELKTLCRSLRVRVLPFFIFYRGAKGRVCSFSCTNATIKKFKDAMAKYGRDGDGYGWGPAKGLEKSELARLAFAGQIALDPATSGGDTGS